MKAKEILPAALLAALVVPATVKLLPREEPEPPTPEVRIEVAPAPAPPATPEAWFARVRPRCTPAEARLATDLLPPPGGPTGVGYKAACLALARQIPSARALLLSLPEEERTQGAASLRTVAAGLAEAGRPDVAEPLLDLVREFVPDPPEALLAPEL